MHRTRKAVLSKREEQVLLLASQGCTDKEIALTLGISTATAKTHWNRIRLKSSVSTRTEAVAVYLAEQANANRARSQAEREQLSSQLAKTEEVVEDLRRDQAYYRFLFDQAPAPLLVLGPAGAIEEVNHAWTRLTGFTREEVVGSPLASVLSPEGVYAVQDAILPLMLTGVGAATVSADWKTSQRTHIKTAIECAIITDAAGRRISILSSLVHQEDRLSAIVQMA